MRSRTSGRVLRNRSGGSLIPARGASLVGVSLCLGLLAPAAQARVYPVPVVVDGEDDLRALYNDGLLEEGDFDTLIVLLDDPLDINRARRSDLYDLPGLTLDRVDALLAWRKSHGPFASVEALRQVEGFDDALMEQISPFIKAVPVEPKAQVPLRGRVRGRVALPLEPVEPLTDPSPNASATVEQLGYRWFPSSYVSAEVEASRAYEIGVLGLMRNDVRAVSFNEDSRDFYVDYGPVMEIGKFYAAVHRVRLNAVVGSYSAGFGLGLTFDRTSRTNPQGLYTDLNVTGTDDYKVSRRLFGAGVRAFNIPAGPLSLDGTVFASSTRGDVYQYDVALAGGEEVDPYTSELSSPRVYLDGHRVSYLTLPNLWREDLGGGNITASLNDRTHMGATVYIARQDRTIAEGVEDQYDWVLSDGWPTDPTYGAFGLNGAWGAGHVDVAAEIAHSYGGGTGLLFQSVVSYAKTEVEATLRRYDAEFSNPYARGQANADTYFGQRDRDEQGGRVKVESQINRKVGLRASADVWQNMSQGVWNAELYGRVSYSPTRDYDLMAYVQHRNRNLAVNGRSRVYGGEFESEFYGDAVGDELTTTDTSTLDAEASPTDRAGSREDVGAQVRVDKLPLTSITVFYKRYYEDAGLLYPNEGEPCYPWYQIGQYTWFKVRVKPTDNTALTARLRYVDDDIYGSLGDRQVEGYLQVDQKLPKKVKVALRGTLGRDLVDAEAAWEDACDSGGTPELSGTCVVDAAAAETEIVREKPYGAVWASAEVKF